MGQLLKFPWYIIMMTKLFLSRLPINYKIWKKIGLFVHGNMENIERASLIFQKHFSRVENYSSINMNNFLEIGPGDSINSGLIASYFGFTNSFLIDNGPFASFNTNDYEKSLNWLNKTYKKDVYLKKQYLNFSQILLDHNITYETFGLMSLKKIQSNSIDFCFTNAVLQHIWKEELEFFLTEIFRVMKPNSVSSHRVNLTDHLANNINNLRFSDFIWESKLFRKSGFYTNRFRICDYENILQKHNIKYKIIAKDYFSNRILDKKYLHTQFRKYSNSELSVSGFDLILFK